MKKENESFNLSKQPLTANILFSGIGCQEKGIKDTNLFDLKVNCVSEINKEAVVSYATIHCGLTKEMIENYSEYPSREEMAQHLKSINLGFEPEKNKIYDWDKMTKKKSKDIEKYWLACKLTNNLGDISKIERLEYADLWTCSFPCQSISIAGKMKGLKPDSETRSSLLWENIRLLKQAKDENILPKYILFENVKNLVSKKFIDDFNDLLSILSDLGFNNYWKVINAKDCGVPQNRERVFVICVRKDIDKCKMDFPKPFDEGIRLKDVLLDKVDDKYYLSDEIQDRLKITDETFNKNVVGTTAPDFRTIGQRDLVYQENSIMGSLVATDYKQPKQILEDSNRCIQAGTLQGEKWDNCYNEIKRYFSTDGCISTITTCQGGHRQPKIQEKDFKVRKLIPTECFILMGLSQEDCQKCIDIGISDSQLYKQAGNGIVTNCVELIFEHLYKAQYDESFKCYDEKF